MDVCRRRTNVQQLTCNIDLSCSFCYYFFSFVLLELKPFVLKGKVQGKNYDKVRKILKKSVKILKRFCPLVVALLFFSEFGAFWNIFGAIKYNQRGERVSSMQVSQYMSIYFKHIQWRRRGDVAAICPLLWRSVPWSKLVPYEWILLWDVVVLLSSWQGNVFPMNAPRLKQLNGGVDRISDQVYHALDINHYI